MPNVTSKQLETYELTIRAMHPKDIDKLHELSITVLWPHRPSDWRMLLKLGKGFVGCDSIGRIVASGMWFPMGDNFATIGMMITSPRLQALGGGRWLIEHVMTQCAGRDLALNSTKAGYRLYQSLDFKPIATVYQHQGIASPVDSSLIAVDGEIRSLVESDAENVLQLDKKAFGIDRANIIAAVLEKSRGMVLIRDGKMLGFALCRKFGRGHVIGPVVAQNTADAIALITPLINEHAGHFLRVDTAQDNTFRDFLNASGMHEFDTVTNMTKSPIKKETTEFHSFALVSQTLG